MEMKDHFFLIVLLNLELWDVQIILCYEACGTSAFRLHPIQLFLVVATDTMLSAWFKRVTLMVAVTINNHLPLLFKNGCVCILGRLLLLWLIYKVAGTNTSRNNACARSESTQAERKNLRRKKMNELLVWSMKHDHHYHKCYGTFIK